MTTIQSCPTCRTVLLPGQQGCVRCGTPAPERAQPCPSCGQAAGGDARFCPACGHRMSEPTAAQPPVVQGPSPFVKVRNPSRTTYLVTGVAVAAVIAIFGGLYLVQTVFYNPERVVAGYFDALADRDADGARKFLEKPVSENPEEEQLTTLPLKGDYQPPTDVKIVSIEEMERREVEGGSVATKGAWREATVDVTLGGEKRQVKLYLHRQEKKEFGYFRDWLIYGGLDYVSVSTSANMPVLINGASIQGRQGQLEALAFPGVYEAKVADNPLLEAPPQKVVVDLMQTESVKMTVAVKPSATADIDSQVRAYLDQCAKSTDLDPSGCPFSMYSYGEVTNVQWKISTYPSLTVQLYGDKVTVGTRTAGRASVTWVGSSGTPYDDDTTFRVSGTAVLVDGKVVFQRSS